MTSVTRRTLLAASGTLAAAAAPRKLRAQEELQSFGEAFKAADPPRPQGFLPFTDADGAPKKVADYAGRGLILNMWATWCVPCVTELPALDLAARKLAPAGILVLPLSSDRQGASVVRAFYMSHGIDDLPVMLDPHGEAARSIGARGIPTTLIIDRKGQELGRLEGAVAWSTDASLDAIRKLLA